MLNEVDLFGRRRGGWTDRRPLRPLRRLIVLIGCGERDPKRDSDARRVYRAASSDDIIAEGSACPSFDRHSGLQMPPSIAAAAAAAAAVASWCADVTQILGFYRAHI